MNADEPVLILIRHAHRDTTNRELDNGLSPKGKNQSLALSKELWEKLKLQKLLSSDSVQLLSSPKRRCIETIEPTATLLKKKPQIDPLLLEQHPSETVSQFKKRVSSVLKRWRDGAPEITMICTHGDWLEYAFKELTGCESEFKKAAWVEITLAKKKLAIRFRSPSDS